MTAKPAYTPLPQSVLCTECQRWQTLHPSLLCWVCRQRREQDPWTPDAPRPRSVRTAKTSAKEETR